jgi:hypothetical protein
MGISCGFRRTNAMKEDGAEGGLSQIRGEYRLKQRIDELDATRKKMGVCWGLAASGLLIAGGTIGVVAFGPNGAMRLHPVAALALFVGLWLHQVGGLAAVIGAGTTWASFWIMQAVTLNTRRRELIAMLNAPDIAPQADPTEPRQASDDPFKKLEQQLRPEAAEQRSDPPQSDADDQGRFESVHIENAGLDILVPAGWTREHVEGVDLFLPADQTRAWPLNMQVQVEADLEPGLSDSDRLRDLVQGFQLTKDGFRLEDSCVVTAQWGRPAVTSAFRHAQDDKRLWTRAYVLINDSRVVTISTTVTEPDRVLMETIFEEVMRQFRTDAPPARAMAG